MIDQESKAWAVIVIRSLASKNVSNLSKALSRHSDGSKSALLSISKDRIMRKDHISLLSEDQALDIIRAVTYIQNTKLSMYSALSSLVRRF